MISDRTFRTWGRRACAVLVALVATCALLPAVASAHAFLDTSDPPANAVVATAPSQVTMRFTEKIQPGASQAELFNADAQKVETLASHMGPNPNELVLPIPANLPMGTYTVQWQNVSAEDGHPNSGYFAFTIGNQANVVLPSPPPAPSGNTSIVSTGSVARWLGLLGLACVIGSFLVWYWVLAPSMAAVDDARLERTARRVRLLALIGAAVALVGSILLLIAQAQSTGVGTGPGALGDIVVNSRFGHLLLARVVILLAVGALAWNSGAWKTPPNTRLRWLALTLIAAAPIPYSLSSHAAAVDGGRPTSVASDWLHVTAASVWIGGLLALVVGLTAARTLSDDRRRQVYAVAIPRFSTMAIISVVILGITGFYASWLEVGNITSLLHTTYGRTLLVKLIALVPLLLLGAFNLLILGPRVRQSSFLARHFGQTIMAEVILGVAILGIAGVLTGLPTAREVTTFSTGHPSFEFDNGGIRAALQIYPGTVGLNRYTVDVQANKSSLPSGSDVFVRLSSNGAVAGQQQVDLPRLPGNKTRFTAQGSELSVVGDWNVDLVVRRPNQEDWVQSTTLTVSKTPLAEQAPRLPLRFLGFSPALGAIVGALGIVALVIGLRRRGVSTGFSRFTAEAGGWMIAGAALVLFLSRAPGLPSSSGNPVPRTAVSVARGQTIYEQHCVICHGSDGHGDGPMAATLNPPPADLHAAHVDYHDDQQLHDWIEGGINGSAMPAFKGKISDTDIWNLVNYVRSLRHPPTS